MPDSEFRYLSPLAPGNSDESVVKRLKITLNLLKVDKKYQTYIVSSSSQGISIGSSPSSSETFM